MTRRKIISRKCVRNRRGWIYLDRGTVLTNIVLSRLPTPSSAELPKFFHSSDVKKFRQQCFPGKLPEVPQAHLTSPKFSLCIHPLYPFIRCRLHSSQTFRTRAFLSTLFLFFLFFYPASITIRQETYATGFKLQTVPTHASAWRQVRQKPGWTSFHRISSFSFDAKWWNKSADFHGTTREIRISKSRQCLHFEQIKRDVL